VVGEVEGLSGEAAGQQDYEDGKDGFHGNFRLEAEIYAICS
jgi:hypothetical protein